MVKDINIRVAPEMARDDRQFRTEAAKALRLPENRVSAVQLLRRSLDARSRQICFQLRLRVFVDEPFQPVADFKPRLQNVSGKKEIFIAGTGPAGLFAALQLIEEGFCPVLLERGKDVRARRRDLAAMNKQGIVNPESNYCFGEGGAGTYSDGKLYTRSDKRGNILKCLQWLHYFGAPESVLIDAHPHIGTNKLPGIITTMRAAIEACGGKVLFNHKITGIRQASGCLSGLEINHQEVVKADILILATGHSARDIFDLLYREQIKIESKPFALGLRIEHPQSLIDQIQYHCRPSESRSPFLPPAAYGLVSQEEGRGVFSFCMCPGGIIAPASTEEGALVVNGWSPSKRDNPYANSGMVVTVDDKDFGRYGFSGDLAAMQYQDMVERKAWQAGGGRLKAPAQRMADFVAGRLSVDLPKCSYLPGLASANLTEVLPEAVYQALAAGFRGFGRKMKGYLTNEAVVVATESRTSSPVRIPRDSESLQHMQLKGFYPCGEGAGYAGGIISAAMDGMKVAMAIGKSVVS